MNGIHRSARTTITTVARRPTVTSRASLAPFTMCRYRSTVKMVEAELKTDDRELIRAASSPAATRPLSPAGSRAPIMAGRAWSGSSSCNAPVLLSASARTPGSTKRNSGSCFSHAPRMVPRRALAMPLAASTRCTMNWSVHQYHTARIGAPNRMPVQGNSGWFMLRQRLKARGCTAACIPSQPPTALRPITVTAIAPPSSTNICTMSVYNTARSPPHAVYSPVSATMASAPHQNGMPIRVSNTMPPAANVTAILVRT